MMYDTSTGWAAESDHGLTQVGKLTKIDNVHLWTHTRRLRSAPGDTFDTRPTVAST